MAEMTVTVTMAPEDFQEFMAWKKDRKLYDAEVSKIKKKMAFIGKQSDVGTGGGSEATRKGQNHRPRTRGGTAGTCQGLPGIKENHLRLVLTTRRRWQYKRR